MGQIRIYTHAHTRARAIFTRARTRVCVCKCVHIYIYILSGYVIRLICCQQTGWQTASGCWLEQIKEPPFIKPAIKQRSYVLRFSASLPSSLSLFLSVYPSESVGGTPRKGYRWRRSRGTVGEPGLIYAKIGGLSTRIHGPEVHYVEVMLRYSGEAS